MANPAVDDLIGLVRNTVAALVRRQEKDLTARQLGIFLTCYLEDEAQTVRGLAAKLNISKPAISRALDRLTDYDLVRRKADPSDRRSVIVQRTAAGRDFMRELRSIMVEASRSVTIQASA